MAKPKTIRMYSLYQVQRTPSGRKRYVRQSRMGLSLDTARRIWQSDLIASAFTSTPLELRPLPKGGAA